MIATFRAALPRVLAAGLLLVLAGCDATVDSNIAVGSDGSTDITVEAHFTGEIADVLADDSDAHDILTRVFTTNGATDVDVTDDSTGRTYRAAIDYAALTAAADITAVEAASIAVGDGTATVTGTLVAPHGVADAIRAQTDALPDGRSVAATMLAQTTVTVSVTFPGDVATVDSAVPHEIDGNTVTFTVDETGDAGGAFTATGSTAAPRDLPVTEIAAGAVVAAAGWVIWRTRSRRP